MDFPQTSLSCPLALYLFFSILSDHVVEIFTSVASVIFRRHNLMATFLILWVLKTFYCDICWALSVGMSIGTGHHSSAFWLLLVVCSGLSLLQRQVSWWGVKTTLICGNKDKCLEIVIRDSQGPALPFWGMVLSRTHQWTKAEALYSLAL